MLNLQGRVTTETCVYQIRVLKQMYVSEEDYKCLNCLEKCSNYKPIGKTGERFNFINFYVK